MLGKAWVLYSNGRVTDKGQSREVSWSPIGNPDDVERAGAGAGAGASGKAPSALFWHCIMRAGQLSSSMPVDSTGLVHRHRSIQRFGQPVWWMQYSTVLHCTVVAVGSATEPTCRNMHKQTGRNRLRDLPTVPIARSRAESPHALPYLISECRAREPFWGTPSLPAQRFHRS